MSTPSLPITLGSFALLTFGLSVAGCAENQPGGASQGEATGGVSSASGGSDSDTKATGKGGNTSKTTATGKGGRAATTSAAAEEGGTDGGSDSGEGGSATSSSKTGQGGSSTKSSRTTSPGGSSSDSSSSASGGKSTQGTGGTKAASSSTGASTGGSTSGGTAEKFSFFVISYKAIIELSGTDKGFGGDLRYGETGDGAGLRGADKICTKVAETSMPGNGKVWRAFLSTSKENAIDRVGNGPWYDRRGRVFAMTKADLLNTRPKGADSAIINDLPNENGVPNHDPDGTGNVDNHDFLTGSGIDGKLFTKTADPACADWTNSTADNARDKRPRVGHSWPRAGFGSWTGGPGGPGAPVTGAGGSTSVAAGNVEGMEHWISALDESGCGPGVNQPAVGEFDGPPGSDGTVGSGGGYGGWYCFALTP